MLRKSYAKGETEREEGEGAWLKFSVLIASVLPRWARQAFHQHGAHRDTNSMERIHWGKN